MAYANPYNPQSWLGYLQANWFGEHVPTAAQVYGQSLNENPEEGLTLFRNFLRSFVSRGQDSFDRWLAGRYSQLIGEYQSKLAENPNLSWLDFLGTVNPIRQWTLLAPGERGERWQDFAPGARWLR